MARRAQPLLAWPVLAWTILAWSLAAPPAAAETGYDLWLRYRPIHEPALLASYRAAATGIAVPRPSATGDLAVSELKRGLTGLLGTPTAEIAAKGGAIPDGTIVVGTPSQLADRRRPRLGGRARPPRRRGLRHPLDAHRRPPRDRDRVAGETSARSTARSTSCGCCRRASRIARSTSRERPRLAAPAAEPLGQPRRQHRARLRRPVAVDWDELPERVDPRIADYARANASIGHQRHRHQQRQRQPASR